MSSQVDKNTLINQKIMYESKINEILSKIKIYEESYESYLRLNKITIFVEKNKEEIFLQKTEKQLKVEQNTLLFKRFNIKDKLYRPYRTGSDKKEKKFIDMFNYKFINCEGKRDGKVKFINQLIDTNLFKREILLTSIGENKNINISNTENKNTKVSNTENKNNNSENKEKLLNMLKKKKINELRIYARDLKINGYSTLNKDKLLDNILELFLKIKKSNITPENSNTNKQKSTNDQKDEIKKSKSEIEKECGIDNSIDYNDNDSNDKNENVCYDDDYDNEDKFNDEFDYE